MRVNRQEAVSNLVIVVGGVVGCAGGGDLYRGHPRGLAVIMHRGLWATIEYYIFEDYSDDRIHYNLFIYCSTYLQSVKQNPHSRNEYI